MNVRLLAPAAAELDEAVAWCVAQAPGLERRFIDEMGTARKRIAERPHAWRPLGDGVRRFRLGRFRSGPPQGSWTRAASFGKNASVTQ